MRLLFQDRYVKLIPKEYASIPNIGDFLEDLDHKRLSPKEREHLDGELLKVHLKNWVENKKKNTILKSFINGANPTIVLRVITKYGHYHTVKFDNGVEIKCPAKIFKEAPKKEEIKRTY